ncbi:hypothetical protein [Leeia sp.]|uniref:hypothetical protein n=1 Tax=Leeia sp. TaxID=2884678 RepID=UPI0035AE8608
MTDKDLFEEAIESDNITLFIEHYEDVFGQEKTTKAVNLFMIYLLMLYYDILSDHSRNCIQSMIGYLKGDVSKETIEKEAECFDSLHPTKIWLDPDFCDEDRLNGATSGMMRVKPYVGFDERERAYFFSELLMDVRDYRHLVPVLMRYLYNLNGDVRFERVEGINATID